MQQIEFRVLGPFEVLVEGRTLELKRPKQRALLALLLLHAGEVVATDRLIDELWAGKPPKAAIGSLQNLISDLRKALGRDRVRTRQPGYVLDVDRERVDLHRFERLVAQADESADADRRSDLLQQALGLWRGPPLDDLAFESFANVEIARLEELRTTAREQLTAAELERGHHAMVIPELETLVAEHPLREGLRGQLMLALYRSGRQAEALDAYRNARDTLVEELGIEPSIELQQLEQAILRHDRRIELPATETLGAALTSPDRRKTVTILFTDIVDSTTLAASLDPEALRSVMRSYFDTVRTIVERHGGTVEKYIGDAAMAVFGIPELHEDDALRAVRSARELGEALVALNNELERDHGLSIAIRTGVNTGEVIAADAEAGEPFATGAPVVLAMRLHEAALPGETLLGEVTHNLLRGIVTSEPVEKIGDVALGEIRAFRLLELSESLGRPPSGSHFVGRTDELGRLQNVFEQVRSDRRSRIVVVLGDAGIGKTRLVSEFLSSLGTEARALSGRCVSYGEGATYLPLREMVHEVAPKRTQATIQSLLEGDPHAALIAQRISELVGESEGAAPTGELFWAIRRFFEALAATKPAVVVLEDIHWAEPTLLELLEYLAAWASDAPVLMLCIARPELLEKRPGWSSTTETVALGPLSGDETTDLLANLGGELELSETAHRRIVGAAEGNALYLEQLFALVTEDGAPDELEGTVPASIEALLASRLDRLEPEDRSFLESAAVVGKDFARAAVRHLTPPENLVEVDDRLGRLERKGLIHARRSRVGLEDDFRFHHVLVRDVAYAGATKGRRADLHERHAGWLEQQDEADELIGYHAEQAHRYRGELRPGDPELGQLASWAGDHLSAAGIRAWKRADTPAAVNLLGRATEILPAGSENRSELLCELGIAVRWAGELELAERTLEEAIASAARDGRVSMRAQIELAHARLFRDPSRGASELLDLAEKAIPVFEERGDDRALGRTWRHVGYVLGGMECQNAPWEEAAERALIHYRRSGWSAAGCLAELASAMFHGPTLVEDALNRCDALLDEATEKTGRANVLVYKGGLEALAGRFDAGRSLISEAARTYRDLDEVYALANNSGRVLGRLELMAGDFEAAEIALRESCEALERFHDWAGLSSSASDLAQALHAQQRHEDARAWAELAESRARADDLSAQFSWRAIAGKLRAAAGDVDGAVSLASEAVRIVERTDAVTQHGDVRLDLAETLIPAGRCDEAREHVDAALELFARKGNVASIPRAEALLSALSVA